jgi:hypothetical protein
MYCLDTRRNMAVPAFSAAIWIAAVLVTVYRISLSAGSSGRRSITL